MVESRSLPARLFDIFNTCLLIAITLVCFLPLWHILMLSLSDRDAINAGLVFVRPVGFNLLSYQKIISDGDFFNSFIVSVKRVVLGGFVGIACILLTAYPLSKSSRQFPGKSILLWIMVFCMLFNGGTIPWYITMRSYKLIDNIWGLVLSGGLPTFYVIIAMNFFKNLPPSLEEAAYVDGAGPWKIFTRIFIPLSKPMIATILLFTIVGHWNEFFQGLVLSTKQLNYPLQTYIQQMVIPSNLSTINPDKIKEYIKLNNKSLDSAKIFIAMIPVMIVYPYLQKYFVKGITLGSVKE